MYLYNIKELKSMMRRQELTEQLQFVYLLIFVGLFSMAAEFYLFLPVEVTLIDKIQGIITLIIQIVGIYLAYRAHGGQSGVNFVPKFLPIYIVLTIRFILILLLLMLVFIPVFWLFSLIIPNEYLENIIKVSYFAVIPIFELFFFWRLIVHLKDVKEVKIS